jgi:hypothetical protein
MPPHGTVLVDQEAIDLLTRWITEDLPKAGLENKRQQMSRYSRFHNPFSRPDSAAVRRL